MSTEQQTAAVTNTDVQDVMGTFGDLRSALFRYYDTPFGVDDRSVMAERRTLLDRDNGAWRDPLIELRPQYASRGISIADSFAEAGAHPDAAEFARFALPDGVTSLYQHQHDALVTACEGKDLVVTAGTGSGKTESFLLPVLADLVAESVHWQGTRVAQREWWQGDGDYVPSRQGEHGHPAAMRVLILYPTNALADDQVVRLRKSLDSSEAHEWLDRKRNGHRYYFGRYTGATPVSGSRDSRPANSRLRQYLREVQERQRKADEKLGKEVRAFIPRLGGAEMHARWDMQAAPPDIMVTNYSMLNIMLLRKQEKHIFSATRKWLEETPGACFTLILDELHMYRGTAGTEVAYLLRNLRHRLGLDKSPEKFRVFAASASLEAGRDDEFLDGFFALPGSRRVIIPGRAKENHSEGDLAVHTERLVRAAKAPISRHDAVALARETGLGPALQRALTPGGKPRALPAPELAKNLFPAVPEEQRQDALHGVLRTLGSAQDPELPQLRAHFFFRNIEGVWACSDPQCPDIPVEHGSERRVGRLFAEPTSRCTCGARVLELLSCQACGDLMLGGYASPKDTHKRKFTGALHTDFPDLDLLPDEASGVPTAANYVVYWPRTKGLGLDDPSWHAGLSDGGPQVEFGFRRSAYQPATGRLENRDVHHTGWSFHISVPLDKESKKPAYDPARLQAFPTRCPACGDDWEIKRDRDGRFIPLESPDRLRNAPVRRMRTGFYKINQVLVTEALGHLPDGQRKAIAFSDSRDDASELASGLALRHYQDLLRLLSAQAVESQGDPFGDLQLVKAHYAGEPVERDGVRAAMRRLRGRNPADWGRLKALLTDDLDAEPELLPDLERKFSELPSLDDLASDLEGMLLKYGTNPAGPAASLQQTSAGQPWTTLYNWERDREAVVDTQTQEELLDRLRSRLRLETVGSLFSSGGRDFESLGLGWLCLRDDRSPIQIGPDSDQTVARASLRILGLMRRFTRMRGSLQGPPAPLKRFWKQVAEGQGTDLKTITDRVLGVWKDAVVDYVIKPEKVALRPGENKAWTCLSCHRPHLHPGAGLCTKCLTPLPAIPQQYSGVLEGDYYAWKAAHSTGDFPLRTAELTGQTDRLEAQRRQSLFQDVFLGDNDVPQADSLELLSVTTTMEAGVDIGPLNTVIMANMPPTRFNYQQRVGRAGRRNSPVAVALTVCRGRSHDEHYFARPEAITNDPTPPPYLVLGMVSVFRRVLLGEVLRQAFEPLQPDEPRKGADMTTNVHGQFGLAADWPMHRSSVRRWIAEHPGRIRAAATALQAGTPESISAIDPVAAIDELLDQVDEVAARTVGHSDFSQRLAEAGLLPMFGFPTRSRLLYRSIPQKTFPWPPADSVSRDLAVALSKFAPGSESPQDGRLLRSMGVVSLVPSGRGVQAAEDPFGPEQLVAMCRICSHVDPQAVVDPETGSAGTCPACGAESKYYKAVPFREPAGFRAAPEARDYDGYREVGSNATSARTATDLEKTAPRIHRAADDWMVVHTGSGDRYIVNTNAGKLFRFVKNHGAWGGYKAVDSPRVEADLEIALGATQHTDMLFIGAKGAFDTSRGLRFDISKSQQTDGFPEPYHGRRAAWYSLAALLRRAAAPHLDVQPEELLSGIHGSDAPVAAPVMAYLADTLDNGAGFSTYLGSEEHIEEFLQAVDQYVHDLEADHHAQNCRSSCYACLRDYSNMRLHPLYDWRLARDLTDALRGRKLQIDPDEHAVLLKGWADEETSVRLAETAAGPVALFTSDFTGEPVAVAVKHPLESVNEECPNERLQALRDEVRSRGFATRMAFADSHGLDRTPAAVIEQVRSFAEDF
ncbi:DEAD/DEAH box helicase [Streptomyces sp. HP-A2021]|uniref:DEAD/DEAH box helicase n=1 Tax=Streptomyces sp. HP-A2021 TaxID=2927875 RepID=UPI001FAF0C3F|nr:DEAD/DEAH box helicase [Streptomyces sp. HP-A2021]UOB08686.1 DEAD/DEAH box helicase [Streptomyces sp. HP-A2021]